MPEAFRVRIATLKHEVRTETLLGHSWEQVNVVWNVEELLRPQGERQSARSEPALVLCSVDVTHVLHMSSVWAQGTPAWHPQVLKSSCSLQCILNSVFIYMFIYSTSSPSENLYKCLIKV